MPIVIKNADLAQEITNHDVLLVGTNIYGRLSNGWQLDAKMFFPLLHKVNIESGYGLKDKLGKCIEVVNDTTEQIFCLLFITKGNFRPDLCGDYLDYTALEQCLHKINIKYKGKSVACPILGVSKFEGNGDRNKILEIFNNTLTDVECTLYDYTQTSEKDRRLDLIKRIMEAKVRAKETKDKRPYYDLVLQRKAITEKLKNINNLTFFEKENG